MKIKLEVVTNVVVLLIGSFVLYSYAGNYFKNRRMYVRAGDHLPSIQGVDWTSHDRTLLLVLKNGCHFCEESMPFYRKLASLSAAHETDAFLTAVVPDDAATAHTLFRVQNLDLPVASDVRLNLLKISGTPTILLVNKQGNVIKAWVGALSSGGEADVVDVLKRKDRASAGSRAKIPGS